MHGPSVAWIPGPGTREPGAPLSEEHVGAGDGVEGAAVSVADADVHRAEVLPDAHVPGRAVRHGQGKARRIDVPRVFEHGDAIELGDGLERPVGVRAHEADAVWTRAGAPPQRGGDPRAALFEPRVVKG